MLQRIVGILVVATLQIATGGDYFCNQKQNIEIFAFNEGNIVTRYENTGHYGKNMDCTWTVIAPNSSRIQFIVTNSNLQWTAENVICNGYDYVQIFDGIEESSSQIISWCGEMNPGFVITTGHKARVTFHTNDRSVYQRTGVTLRFTIFNDSDCPTKWYSDRDNKYCYMIRDDKETFQDAQQYCTYSQANLVSLKTEKQLQYVTELVVYNKKQKILWTGLNDILVNGKYRWLDGSRDHQIREWKNHSDNHPNSFLECVTYDVINEVWQEQYCRNEAIPSQNKFPFICQMNKGSSTPHYEVPDPNKGEGASPPDGPANGVWIAIGVGAASGILVLLIVFAVIVVLFRKRHGLPKPRRQPTAPPTYNDVMSQM